MSYTAFSQTLKPKVLQIEADTNFCFTIPQSKVLATYLIKGEYADSLEVIYDQQKSLFQQQQEVQDSIRWQLESKIKNLDLIINHKEQSILILNDEIKFRDKKLKRAKWHKILLGAASIVSSAAIILK